MNTTNHAIPVNLAIAAKIGSDPALVLQQIKYWTEKSGKTLRGEEGAWIYNTYKEWYEQFPFWSISKIRRIIKFLEDKGLIFSKKVNAKKWNHTKWYSINFEKLNQLFVKVKTSIKKVFSKGTNRSVQNEQIIDRQENNYTKNTLSKSLPLKKIKKKNIKEKREEREKNKIKEEEGDIAKKMIMLWEANIPSKGREFTLTKVREESLRVAFRRYFNSDLKQWENFISIITRSKFLMGEVTDFRIFLDWAIREENLLNILEGNYRMDREVTVDAGKKNNDAILKLKNDSTLDSRWKNMLQDALEMFGEDTYISWLSKMELDSEKDGILKVRTPSGFIREHLDIHFGKKLHCIGKQYFKDLRKICFTTN